MNTKIKSLLFTGLVALLAEGCGVSVEADAPEVTVTQRDLAFDGVPLAALVGPVSVSRKFSQKHKKLDLPSGLDSEVKALGVTLTAKTGIKDFGFLHALRISMSDDVHTPVQLVEYEQPAGGAPSSVLEMKSANPVNTLEQWKTDSATFTVEVAGTLPTDAWTVDLTLHFGGSFTYKR
jgi:hypothetical protein